MGTLTGFVPGAGKLLPGVTAGRGSYNAVSKQMVTKLRNGQIQNISAATAAKMLGGELAQGIPGAGAGAVAAIPLPSSLDDCTCQR